MNTKLLNTLKTLCVVGALAATSFSVIAAPVEGQTKVIKEKAAVVCNVGYIEDTIVKIDEKNKQVIVGDAEDKGAQIIINVTKQTNIFSVKDKKVYTFSDLEVGQKIGIESNGMMTNGQLTAFVLTVMEDENEEEENLAICPVAGYITDTIVGIDADAQTIILGDATDKEAQIVVKVNEDTQISHELNKRAYTFADFEVGQQVILESNGIMTNGQVTAFFLTILDEQEENLVTCPVAGYLTEQIAKIDKEAKTITLGDKKDEESQIIVKVTENTKITDAKNKKVVKFSDLKVCQTISVESNGMMINGQVEAFEITIQ